MEKGGNGRPGEEGGFLVSVMQIEYTVGPSGPVIHVFGRDRTKKAVHVQVTGFRPYFYVPAELAPAAPPSPRAEVEAGKKYTSIRGEELVRIYTQKPTDVREERERYRAHFEADIPFTTRFAIDCGIRGGLFSPSPIADYREVSPADADVPPRICMVDIECEDVRGFPQPARDAIV